MFNIGPLELIVVLIIALIVLGPQRLPDAARSVGRGIREFRGALNMDHDDDDDWESPAPPKEPAVESHKSGSPEPKGSPEAQAAVGTTGPDAGTTPEAQAAAATTRPDAATAPEPPKPAAS